MITGEQVRAARALLKWGQWRLANAAHISIKAVAKIEGAGLIDKSSGFGIRRALEAAGIEFLSDEVPGVRLRRGRSITGWQLQEARRLLRLSAFTVAQRAHMLVKTVERAEAALDGVVPLTVEQSERLKGVFERAGIEFFRDPYGRAGVRRGQKDGT